MIYGTVALVVVHRHHWGVDWCKRRMRSSLGILLFGALFGLVSDSVDPGVSSDAALNTCPPQTIIIINCAFRNKSVGAQT